MEEAVEFLRQCGTYYLATVEGDQARVRPMGALDVFEGRLYIQTGNIKKVFAQMKANPKVELCAMVKEGGTWIRIEAKAVQDDRLAARQHMLETNPGLRGMYAADDGNMEVLYLKDATATIASFTAEPRVFKF